MTKEYSDYLAHYGVKGQKWGVRNWQNEDGTYTDAGKNHYGWGYGYQNRGSSSADSGQSRQTQKAVQSNAGRDKKNVVRQEQDEEARKIRTRNIILAAAGVSIAALAAYKGGKALKSWAQDARVFRYQVERNKTNMEWNRFESMRSGGWSKTAEKSYRRNIRNMDNAVLKSYFTRRKRWY